MGLLSMYWRCHKLRFHLYWRWFCTKRNSSSTWSCTFMENSVISQEEARIFTSVTMLQSLTTCGTLWDNRGIIWIFLSWDSCVAFLYVCRETSSVYVPARTQVYIVDFKLRVWMIVFPSHGDIYMKAKDSWKAFAEIQTCALRNGC